MFYGATNAKPAHQGWVMVNGDTLAAANIKGWIKWLNANLIWIWLMANVGDFVLRRRLLFFSSSSSIVAHIHTQTHGTDIGTHTHTAHRALHCRHTVFIKCHAITYYECHLSTVICHSSFHVAQRACCWTDSGPPLACCRILSVFRVFTVRHSALCVCIYLCPTFADTE